MIREAKREDIPSCVRVIRESFRTVADAYGITEANAPRFTAFAVSADRLYRQMAEGRPMFVAEADGVLCGFCALQLLGNGACELQNLAVLPAYRHRGLGGRLLTHAAETARGMGYRLMEISIVEENTVLRKWYEANGAVHVGTRKFDFFPFTCGYLRKAL